MKTEADVGSCMDDSWYSISPVLVVLVKMLSQCCLFSWRCLYQPCLSFSA